MSTQASPNCRTVIQRLDKASSRLCSVCDDGPCRYDEGAVAQAVRSQACAEMDRLKRIVARSETTRAEG